MPANILAPSSRESNFKIAADTHTTVAAADVVTTGLKRVLQVAVSFETDPADAAMLVSAVPSGADDGKFTLKTWRNTAGTDPTPIAADAFSKKINWIAFGY